MNSIHSRTNYLISDLIEYNVTIEDLARAAASIDGKLDLFDKDKFNGETGYYEGYISDMKEILKRARIYASEKA